MRKKEGSVDKFAVALVTILMGIVLTMANISFTGAMEAKSIINSIVREYMLSIESNGMVEETSEANLRADIAHVLKGVAPGGVIKDADLVVDILVTKGIGNTDLGKVQYGDKITINVDGKDSAGIPVIVFDSWLGDNSKIIELPFSVTRSSIAKVVE